MYHVYCMGFALGDDELGSCQRHACLDCGQEAAFFCRHVTPQSSETRRVEMNWIGPKRNEAKRNELKGIEMKQNESKRNETNGTRWIGLDVLGTREGGITARGLRLSALLVPAHPFDQGTRGGGSWSGGFERDLKDAWDTCLALPIKFFFEAWEGERP